jgi:hypothetical protein
MSTEISLRGETCSTNGKGYWSSCRHSVTLEYAEVAYEADDGDFGELRVYFDTRTWNVNKHGLIYTDPQFLQEFRGVLRNHGFGNEAVAGVNYSEQGMQGDDYVSMDITGVFLRGCKRHE